MQGAVEAALAKEPRDVAQWCEYALLARREGRDPRPALERAVHHVPGSYKLWHLLLSEPGSLEERTRRFERAVLFLHRMPRIWLMYAEALDKAGQVSAQRLVLDR